MQALTSTQNTLFVNEKLALVKINKDSNVNMHLKAGTIYYMYLSNTDEFLKLYCSFVAMRAADMKIMKHIRGENIVTSDLNCTFGYQFEHYDSVNFTSFSYREPCELYVYQNVFLPEQSPESLFVCNNPTLQT